MKVYLDVSCLNRPFDDQRQARVRIEAEAVLMILALVESGEWSHVSSTMAVKEINAGSDWERRDRMLEMLPEDSGIMEVSDAVLQRGEELERVGLHAADAIHVAAAEAQQADAFVTCDDRLLRVARRRARMFRVRVCDPITLMREQ